MIGRRLAIALVLAAGPAAAHDRTTSYSSWDIRGRTAVVTLGLSAFDVSRFPWATGADRDAALGTYVARHLRLEAGEAPCDVAVAPRALDAPPGRVVYEWSVRCAAAGALAIRSDLLFEVAPGHLHFARAVRDGEAAAERVLGEREARWLLDGAPAARGSTSVVGYARLGVEHIAGGADHLAFLLALLLLGSGLVDVARLVTGFTLGHSLTLGAAALGWIQPDRAAVEALIGLSIALVAIENLWLVGERTFVLPAVVATALALLAISAAAGWGRVPAVTLGGVALFAVSYFGLLRRVRRPATLRWGIAFLFGLVHGFGFAAVLMEARLAADRIVPALFGFNVGVEVGQLGVVALIWSALRVIDGRGKLKSWVLEAGSAAVLALGLFWFVSRAYG